MILISYVVRLFGRAVELVPRFYIHFDPNWYSKMLVLSRMTVLVLDYFGATPGPVPCGLGMGRDHSIATFYLYVICR